MPYSSLLCCIVLLPGLAQAAGSDSSSLGIDVTGGFGMASYFRMLWGLLIVLGIMLILYGLLRKRFSLLHRGNGGEIKVREVKPLMGKKALCLVEVRGQSMLLGLSGDRIDYLSSLPEHNAESFADVLHRSKTARNTAEPDAGGEGSTP